MATETRSRPAHSESLQQACVYCLSNHRFTADQILVRGEQLYLSVPAGQLVEGYLVVAPYVCVPSLSRMPAAWFDELAAMTRIVRDFYRAVYGIDRPLLYEQGRAGGDAICDPDARFPYHAHLCGLPLELDLHAHLSGAYRRRAVAGPHDLSRVVADAPYIYVESVDAAGASERAVYVEEGVATGGLERSRLKPEIARLIGAPGRGDWRMYPGEEERERVIQKFAAWRR